MFCTAEGLERGREGERGSARGDKNLPNPSLITMPAKSEILTAAAPLRKGGKITERERERGRDREEEGEKERRQCALLRN